MAASGVRAWGALPADAPEPSSTEHAALLGAVREDVRQTLRCGWVDPAIDAAAAQPVFFTAAWSAVRPNVGRTFLSLARAVRTQAADALRAAATVPDLRIRLARDLVEEELRRAEETTRAAHQASAKAQLVAHALLLASRRERIDGTGREEPSVRRGIPEWQRWMAVQPTPEASAPVLDEAAAALRAPVPPVTLRLLARWPAALRCLWDEAAPAVGTEAWTVAAARSRRAVMAGIGTLPHPVELQWAALRERGFSEEDRRRLCDTLAEHEAAMAHQTLLAAFAWLAFGGIDGGPEGER